MLKMQVIMDEEKIRREGKYDLKKVQSAIDDIFVNKCSLIKGADGFYIETGTSADLALFTTAIGILKRTQWFFNNVGTWLLYDSTDRDDPNDFIVEDVKEYYRAKYAASA